MKAIIFIALIVLLALCAAEKADGQRRGLLRHGARTHFRRNHGPRPRRERKERAVAPKVVSAEDEEEADAEFLKSVLKKVGKVALQAGKAYVGAKTGIQLDDDEEEADAEFLGKALKKVGKVALSVGKIYARTQGIPIDEAEVESDAEFLGKALKKVGKVALQVGKSYVANKYGVNLDEEEEEADAEFLKNVLKKVGKVALQAGKAYLGAKTGIQLDDEEADFINLKKVLNVAKNVGKSYLSSKYGINLDEEDEEEADLKLGNFFKKALNVAKNVGKSYLSSKYGINLDEEEEADFINWKKIGGIAKDIGKNYLSTKYGINLDEEEEEESDAEFLNQLKNWWKSKGESLFQKGLQIYSAIKSAKKQPAQETPAPAVEAPVAEAEAPAQEEEIESDSESSQSINGAGLNLIKQAEGWRACVYKDAVGLPTIGYGHLIKAGEKFNCISQSEGENLLRRDVASFESCVSRNVKVPINSNQFSALVSFSFNLGCGNLQSSTLLKKINAKAPISEICGEFKKWTKAGGKVLPGLVTRRDNECNLYRS